MLSVPKNLKFGGQAGVYQGFYGFSCNPFAAPADASQIFMAAGHRDALSSLILRVLKRQPFVAVAGEEEVGKTTVLNAALASLADQRRRKPARITRLAYSHHSCLSARQIIGQMLGKQASDLIDDDLKRLSCTLTKGRNDGSQHLLVIDDAPSVNSGALEFLHLLSGLQTQGVPYLQVILAGRHAFWETLTNKLGGAIRNQVATRSAVEPLADDEVRRYIDYRLKLADSSIARVVTDAALSDVIRHGQALPGRINRVLDLAFTVGAAQGSSRLTPQVVNEAVMLLQTSNLLPPVPVVAAPWTPCALGMFNTSSHASSDRAEDPSPSVRTGKDNEARFAPPSAIWGSTWLAGAVTVVVLGIVLTSGTLQPKVVPHMVAASVASADAVTATFTPADAYLTADKLSYDANRPELPTDSASIETASHAAPWTSYENPIGTGEVLADTTASIPVNAFMTTDRHTSDASIDEGSRASTKTVSHISARTSDEEPTEEAPTGGIIQPVHQFPAIRPIALSEPPSPVLSPWLTTDLADRPAPYAKVTKSDMEPSITSLVPSPVPYPVLSDLSASQITRGRREDHLDAQLTTASPRPEPVQTVDNTAAKPSISLPATVPLPPDVLAKLLERGAVMLAAGDISAARLLYKRAAAAGNAQAAVEVGKTYDPMFLATTRAVGVQADPIVATNWYRQAVALGDTKAASLLPQSAAIVPQ